MTLISAGITTGTDRQFELNSDGLVGRWTWEYPAQTGLIDTVGDFGDGTISGMTFTSDAQEGSTAGVFDGADDQVEWTGVRSTLNDVPELTYAIWVRTTAPNQHIVAKEDKYPWHRLGLTSSGAVHSEMTLGSGNHVGLDGTTALGDGLWHHIAVVFDGSTFAVYADGSQEASSAESTGPQMSTMPLTLGYDPNAASYITVDLDDFRVYNRGLSSTELSDIAAGWA